MIPTNIKTIIILVLLVSGVIGLFFWDDAVKIYNLTAVRVDERIKDFKESEINSAVIEATKKVFMPSPLKIGGAENEAVLLKTKIIQETNRHRASFGLAELSENAKLSNAASAKATDMFKNQYFDHVSPLGVDPGKLALSHGYEYIIVGENLILGNFADEKEVVQKWMDSPGHRENILNIKYTEIGVSIIKGEYNGESAWIGVQEFGLPLSSCAQPDKNLNLQIESEKLQLQSLSESIDEKKQQIENTNKKSPVYRQMVEDYNLLVSEYNLLAEQIKENIGIYNSQVNIFNACAGG